LDTILTQKKICELRQNGVTDSWQLYENLKHPDDGIFVHGIFMEAGKWDSSQGGLIDSGIGELTTILPVLWLKPCSELAIDNRYQAPLYKTQVRAGVLSTTGHSTNFVLSVLLSSEKPESFWTLRGTALVTLLTD
jgi:dynein heavy chain, axonemal